MTLTNYTGKSDDSFVHSIKEGYKQADNYRGIPGAANGAYQYASHHKTKAGLAVGTLVVVAALTAAYFMSPGYAAYVGMAGAKAAALVSPAINAVSALMVAHPLVATFAIIAALSAVVTAGVLAYKNNDKASQIENLTQGNSGKASQIIDLTREDTDKANKINEAGKILINGDAPESKITNLKKVLGFAEVSKSI